MQNNQSRSANQQLISPEITRAKQLSENTKSLFVKEK